MLSVPGIGDLRLAEQGSLPSYPPRGTLSIMGEARCHEAPSVAVAGSRWLESLQVPSSPEGAQGQKQMPRAKNQVRGRTVVQAGGRGGVGVA